MKAIVSAIVAGALFAVGLAVSGMTEPARVIGFLDLRHWDPTLAFVMAAAIAVYAPAAWLARRRVRPLLAPAFAWPTRTAIDGEVVVGSAIFGVGWGIAGYCPGPALVSAAGGASAAAAFVAAMFAGMWLARRRLRHASAASAPDCCS